MAIGSMWLLLDGGCEYGRDISPDPRTRPEKTIKFLALPKWAKLSIESRGLVPENLEGAQNQELRVAPDDYGAHSEITELLRKYLFYRVGDRDRYEVQDSLQKLHDRLTTLWFGVLPPISSNTRTIKLNLHPYVIGNDLIVFEHSEHIDTVTDVNIYERLLRCLYTLSTSVRGVNAFDSMFFQQTLTKFMEYDKGMSREGSV